MNYMDHTLPLSFFYVKISHLLMQKRNVFNVYFMACASLYIRTDCKRQQLKIYEIGTHLTDNFGLKSKPAKSRDFFFFISL